MRFILSGSTAKYWVNCPAYPRLSHNIEIRPTEEMKEGTLAHKLAEEMLNDKDFSSEYPKEMIIHIEGYKKFVLQKCEGQVNIYVERSINGANIYPDCGGTPDVFGLTIDGKRIILIDLKYGKNSNNYDWQLKFYAALLYSSLSTSEKEQFEGIEAYIYQPRVDAKDIIKGFFFQKFEIEEYCYIFNKAAEMTDTWRSEPIPGDHCKGCRAMFKCPHYINQAEKAILNEDGFEYDFSAWLDVCTDLKKFIPSVERAALDYVKEGNKIDNYELVPSRPMRKWEDEDEIMQILWLDHFTGVIDSPKLILSKTKAISPAELEKAIGKELFKANYEKYTVKESSGRVFKKSIIDTADFDMVDDDG